MTARDLSPPRRSFDRARSDTVLFYLWLPLGMGLFLGFIQPGRSAAWPIGYSIAYWIVLTCADWWLADLGCRIAHRLLKPWRPSLATILLTGSIGASLLFIPPINRQLILTWYAVLPPGVPRVALSPWPDVDPGEVLAGVIPGLMPWFVANYVFYRFLGLARYGVEPRDPAPVAGPAAVEAAAPVFLGKVRADRRGELLALNAQGHYLRVITTQGEDLVLHTFGDAVEELGDAQGVRVHRSWWVARRALGDGDIESSRRLRLANGLEIPVSRTFRAQLQRELAQHGRSGA